MSTVNENHFPELMKVITEDPSAAERLDLECPICMQSITINNSNDPPGTDSHDAGCGHPNTKGTLLRLSNAWRLAMYISVLDSNRTDEFCVSCYFDFITHRLTMIAFNEFDFSNLVTGRRVVKLFLKWGEKVYKSLSCPKNTTTIMELPIQPILRNAIERIRQTVARMLDIPADKTAELEFHLTLVELNPTQGPEALLDELSFLSQISDMQDVSMALQRPGASRESIANANMLRLCHAMSSGHELNAQVRSHIRSGHL
ncbi:Ff.00g033010.m01.CDS01 [Fusarium sp. VM40]|nr:Ff.00g033010.m01.CDS01 [Fusarium sp. VM40]